MCVHVIECLTEPCMHAFIKKVWTPTSKINGWVLSIGVLSIGVCPRTDLMLSLDLTYYVLRIIYLLFYTLLFSLSENYRFIYFA